MDRRQFLAATCLGALVGCSDPLSKLSEPAFSRERLLAELEKLRLAFESRGHHASNDLLPGIKEDDLVKQCQWFPAALPPEILALYAWHGGQAKSTWDEEFPFWFRDCGFSSIATAEDSYKSMMESYGVNPTDHDLLQGSFPFAEFNGGWLVLPTAPGGYRGFKRPVVSVFQGVDVWFESVSTMVETCIDWVTHPQWTDKGDFPADIERAIWKKHNPRVF